jgi:hypothetical protein
LEGSAMKYLRSYIHYSCIFGKKYEKAEFIRRIKELPQIGGFLVIVSQLLSNPSCNEDLVIRENFIEFLSSLDEHNYFDIREKIAGHYIYTPQSLLTVWKWLLAYGDLTKLEGSVDRINGLNAVLYFCIIVSDFLNESIDIENLKYELIQNGNFNNYQDNVAEIARTIWIYDYLAKDKTLYEEKEYIDINKEFKSKYGYEIKQYISYLYGIIFSFTLKGNESWT